jgi:hypothetical protein
MFGRLLTSLALAWVLAPAVPALAADRAMTTVTSPDLGLTFAVPSTFTADIARYPDAPREQTREVVTILQDRTEALSLEVFHDPRPLDLRTWVRQSFDFMIKHGKLRETRATLRNVPALELAMPGGQVQPQTIRFWRVGPLFFRLTLVDSGNAAARVAFASATATFDVRKR